MIPERTLAEIVFRRRGKVLVRDPGPGAEAGSLQELEGRLGALGYRLEASLHRRLAGLPDAERDTFGRWLHFHVLAGTGGDRPHQTLATRAAGEPAPDRDEQAEKAAPSPANHVVLAAVDDLEGELRGVVQAFLGRPGALRPDEAADLVAVLEARPGSARGWLPPRIPARATMALALGTCLRLDEGGPERQAWRELAPGHLGTGTDLLRVLAVRAGGDPMLQPRPRFGRLPRALRGFCLDFLEGLPVPALIEDMRRRPADWKRLGERLHPFERHRTHPRVAAAFAVLRETRLSPEKPLLSSLRVVVEATPELALEGSRLRFRGAAARVEAALAGGRVAEVLEVLRRRPGELLRRLDHLLRVVREEEVGRVMGALEACLPRVSPQVLVTCLAHFRSRSVPLARRVFVPQGAEARPWGTPDIRAALPGPVVAATTDAIARELLGRAASQQAVEVAVLDEELRDLRVPTGAARAAAALVQLPRGSSRPLPQGDRLRLFLHWMEARDRVDLDLSVAFFGGDWEALGLCDYTQVDFADGAACHSGDLTSAPPPKGATEYLDLDLAALEAAGVRFLMMGVYSFNRVPFETLPHAFAGFAVGPEDAGDAFDPGAVRQRLDLTGAAQIAVPLLLDLQPRRLLWLDLHLSSQRQLNSVEGSRSALGRMGRDLLDDHGGGARPSLGEVACLHAAGCAGSTVVRDPRGRLRRYRRRADEDALAYFRRLEERGADDGEGELPRRNQEVLAALVRADLRLPERCRVYALHPDQVPGGARRMAAEELVGALAPAARP